MLVSGSQKTHREDAPIVSLRPKKEGCESVNIPILEKNEVDEMGEVGEVVMKDSGCPRAMRGIAARVQPPWAQI